MIKAVPGDFIVQEKADFPLRPKGEYRIYLLRKSGWNTLDLIRFLSWSLGLPPEKFSYGGKKDKHGLTQQFIAIQDQTDYSREGKDFSLGSRGFMDRPMGPDLVQGNSFTVTIRKLANLDLLEKNIDEVRKTGFPNFFDDQRFRSYDPNRGFFAEKILQRHWNGALQVYLTSAGSDLSRKEKERKEALFNHWKDWSACLSYAQEPLEKGIFGYLAEHPKDFAPPLHQIPQEEVSMLYAAFQSHLWNEVLRRVVKLKVEELVEIKGAEGGYFFWRNIDEGAFSYLGSLEIPTSSAQMDFPDDLTRSIYEEVLKEKNLRPGSFRTKALRRVYFKSFKRKAMIMPDGLRIGDKGRDALHPARMKMTISFSLPRGSYGTMLVKRITLEPRA